MYLRRKIDSFLQNWKENPNRLPLIVKGARQVGKTEAILHFAEKNYKNIVYINFVTDDKFKQVIQEGYQPTFILKNMSK